MESLLYYNGVFPPVLSLRKTKENGAASFLWTNSWDFFFTSSVIGHMSTDVLPPVSRNVVACKIRKNSNYGKANRFYSWQQWKVQKKSCFLRSSILCVSRGGGKVRWIIVARYKTKRGGGDPDWLSPSSYKNCHPQSVTPRADEDEGIFLILQTVPSSLYTWKITLLWAKSQAFRETTITTTVSVVFHFFL